MNSYNLLALVQQPQSLFRFLLDLFEYFFVAPPSDRARASGASERLEIFENLVAKTGKNFVVAVLVFSALTTTKALAFTVGLVLDKGGRDDRSFNASAYAGAEKAQKELGIELKYVEVTDVNSIETLHRGFARKNFDLIIGIGFAQSEAVNKVAAQNPKLHFAVIDGESHQPNVDAVQFSEQEGAYLMGALAARKSKTHRIGFIGGMEIPLIKRFEAGYRAGSQFFKPPAQVSSQFVGITAEAWNNPAKAKELALAQYSQGCDIIFVAAGASGQGVFDAAEEQKKWAIGVDSNQNYLKPGFILTSMLKRVDLAIFKIIESGVRGQYNSGNKTLGIAEQGVDYAIDSYNEKLLSKEDRSFLADLKGKIALKKISIPKDTH